MSTSMELESALAGELEMARQVQASLLPQRICCLGTWMFAYSYEPASAVGGDYVDLIRLESGDFYFALGEPLEYCVWRDGAINSDRKPGSR